MAKIKLWQQEPSMETTRGHTEVTCKYRTVIHGGQILLQLDTGGSEKRQIKGKVSQSIQLDQTGAQRLLAIIEETFPTLRP